ncbi:family 16 glycosylhydrolase [Luteimonas sp. R10]|uniref:glycoside hydrolase family 16 protein n=1 Tax=Luteimonas sp. R10 TaxID=3108176 RepID=UPI00309136F7|nr:glycoside hydrolase family 16 protein [Luteimonas sp. R10]
MADARHLTGRIFGALLWSFLAGCAGQPAARDAPHAGTAAGAERTWTFEPVPAWRDEFDYTGPPDPAKWSHDLGGGGWGNNELQHYTDRIGNAAVADGVLTITARREPAGEREYSSARLVSRGKGDFLYGRIEARARVPHGRGTWPAIWMLATDRAHGGWPDSGEIDIMEHVGFDPERVHMSVHTKTYNHVIGTQRTATHTVPGAMSGFHRYRVDWTPDAIRGYIDDAPVFTFANEGSGPDAWPFDRPFHLLLNIAVGGDWGGQKGVDTGAFPATMEVDYVRVYALAADGGGGD